MIETQVLKTVDFLKLSSRNHFLEGGFTFQWGRGFVSQMEGFIFQWGGIGFDEGVLKKIVGWGA